MAPIASQGRPTAFDKNCTKGAVAHQIQVLVQNVRSRSNSERASFHPGVAWTFTVPRPLNRTPPTLTNFHSDGCAEGPCETRR